MPTIGSVADDLTGATTVGVLLARAGARTVAFFNEDAAEVSKNLNDYQSVIISSNSRALLKEQAYEKVSKATRILKSIGIKQFSKRIDTTLRGGIGVEIDAMMDQLNENTVAIVVPSMPQSNRILVGGFSIINNISLIKTPVANDVRTPVRENFIPKLLQQQTKREVGLITLDYVLRGQESIKKEIMSLYNSGKRVLVIDAVSIEDVDNIAKSVIDLGISFIAVDPGPLTERLSYHNGYLNCKPEMKIVEKNIISEDEKTVLVIAGSATPVTKKQIEQLCNEIETARIEVDPLALIKTGEATDEEISIAVKKAVDLLKSNKKPKVILIETALHGTILDLEKEDNKLNYPQGTCANRINASLGAITAGIMHNVDRNDIAGLYMTGGDTMVNVCTELGIECIELIDYVIPQVDLGILVGKELNGLPVVGKGGLTGNENTAIEIVNRLFKEDRKIQNRQEEDLYEEENCSLKLENAY